MKLIHTKKRFIKKFNQKSKKKYFEEKAQELPDYYQDLSTDIALNLLDKAGETRLKDAEYVGWTVALNEDAKLSLEKILDFNLYNLAVTREKKQTGRTKSFLREAVWQENYDIYRLVVASNDMDDEEGENGYDYDLDFGNTLNEELDEEL